MSTAPVSAPSTGRRVLAGAAVLLAMLAVGWALGAPVNRSLVHAVLAVVVVQVALALPARPSRP